MCAAAFPLWINAVDALPTTAPQTCSLHVNDLFTCDLRDPTEHWEDILLSSFLTDLNWLLSAAPGVGQLRGKLCLLSGDKGTATVSRASAGGSPTFRQTSAAKQATNPLVNAFAAHGLDTDKLAVLEPPLPHASGGTHHAKFALCVNKKGVRVAVFTANLIHSDWANKTQGVYVQDFPRVRVPARTTKGDDFKQQLTVYLQACGLMYQSGDASSPLGHFARCDALDAFDFSQARVWLVTSTPGIRSATEPEQGGWRRLQQVLARLPGPASPTKLTWQYSSQGALTDAFVATLTDAMLVASATAVAAHGTAPLTAKDVVQVVYPTQDEVRQGLEGWRGGLSLPLRMQGCHPFVNERLHRWAALSRPHRPGEPLWHARQYALPHIKTYARVTSDSVVWLLLTSANLSQPAWGSAGGRISSYEVGVLFDASSAARAEWFTVTPSHPWRLPTPETAADLMSMRAWSALGSGARDAPAAAFMLPYDVVSPQPYASNASVRAHNASDGGAEATAVSARDIPWVLDFPHGGRDALGRTFEEAMEDATVQGEAAWMAPVRQFPPSRGKRPRDTDNQLNE